MPQTINLNDTTPAASANFQNLPWKADAPNTDPTVERNVSVSVPKMTAVQAGIVPTPPNDGTKFLAGDATYKTISSGAVKFESEQCRNILYGYKHGDPDGLGASITGPFMPGDGIYSVNFLGAAADISTSGHGAGSIYTTSSTGAAGFVYGELIYRVGRGLKISGTLWLSRVTDTRFLFGIAAGQNGDDFDIGFDDMAFFRFSTIAGDSNFQCMTGDGTSTTVVNSGVAADLLKHKFAIIFDDVTPNVKFYIDGVLVATHTTTLPRTAHDLGYVIAIRGNSTNNAISFGQIVIAYDF